MRRGSRPGVAVLAIDDLTVDRVSHSVQRNGHAIDLSPKEFALLEFLMRHAGQPVTRSAIIEQVWKLNFDTMTNVVDVYINYLRRKVDTGYDRAPIRTVRGRRYQSVQTPRPPVQQCSQPLPNISPPVESSGKEPVAASPEAAEENRTCTKQHNRTDRAIGLRPHALGTAIPGCAPKSHATASFTSPRIPAIFFTNSPGIP